ncbi:hypothetical protein J2S40_000172 [Nocardioides luteus]|uniref:Excalibur calcium-binding domain-containing protein n=1 Tax=Nocardioides luteus TaxID=1844 RepID=A0ABQ5SU13_9ACTN|nr:DUF1524 domain-containing protein [Nocardioides luteus]MDR7309114.1 hypothetical protein [Nocardioides luteus]GGR49712.1 hypothetical protein GCM10010197_14570 [Nocardioides luteus]GLJ67520.1 hypothetical protein GCM10017579_15560 [Nocardioides luteus]
MLRPLATLFAVVLLCAGCAEIPEPETAVQAGYGASSGEEVSLPLNEAIAKLPVAEEVGSGYEREKFKHWVDADGDCQDTRVEVLFEEARKKARGKCEVTRGEWVSVYDATTVKRAGGLDIDHMVPLKESWESGADAWDDEEREAYANDLGDPRALVAVTAASNRSKSDQDPADWMPDDTSYHCTYVSDWVAVKIRWSLFVDPAEKAALEDVAAGCDNPEITVRLAQSGPPPGDADPSESPAATPAGGSSDEDPRFDTCAKAIAEGFGPYQKGRDAEYEWYRDGDKDGTVCDR